MLSTWAPFYFTNLLEHYSGVYEYAVGTIDATSGQYLIISFNLLSFFFGSNVYFTPLKEILFFLPEFITRDFILLDVVMIIVIYVGVIYTMLLVYFNLKSANSFTDKVECFIIMTLHFSCYIFLYLFNSSLNFLKESAALVYISIGFLFCILTTKLIVCTMSKMKFHIIHLEYLIPLLFILYLKNCNKNVEESLLRYEFYLFLASLAVLYFRCVQVIISQITHHLEIYCFVIKKRKEN